MGYRVAAVAVAVAAAAAACASPTPPAGPPVAPTLQHPVLEVHRPPHQAVLYRRFVHAFAACPAGRTCPDYVQARAAYFNALRLASLNASSQQLYTTPVSW